MTAQLRLPTEDPAKSAPFRSMAIGLKVFSTGLLPISTRSSARHTVRLSSSLTVCFVALPSVDLIAVWLGKVMCEIMPLTPDLLAELGNELGGCDFTDQSQIDFLAKATTCDVQAAPGNGKTTLLAAKLALLSRNWSTRRRGVCVISHTNAARTEVEEMIARHPTAAGLRAYPHFIGTVTGFINQHLALPYLRGLGWHVRQIDDDVFEAEALRR